MENNKNTIIAIVLMLAVWVAFSVLFPPRQPPPAPSPVPSVNTGTATGPAPPAAPREEGVRPDAASIAPAPTIVGNERKIIVDHPLYLAVFTNLGGRLVSFELKNYTAAPDNPIPVNLVLPGPSRQATLATFGTDALAIPADAYYEVAVGSEGLRLQAGQESRLVFTTTTAAGLTVEKVYTFKGDLYPFDLDITVKNGSSAARSGSLALALVAPQPEGKELGSFEFVGATTLAGGEVDQVPVDKMEKEAILYPQPVGWTAFGDKYFLSAVVPQPQAAEKIRVGKEGPVARNVLETPVVSLPSGGSTTFHYLLYFGPRDLEILKQVGYQLGEAVDFGMFSIIAKPLLHFLKFFYRYLGNYGLAIILLTVIIKLIFWPLTQKSYASMKAMQKLQPEMQRIREKFGKDRDRMNREIMELYKKHRVNPLGGCLPMLVQIPVFFALYKVLMEAIEVRHAPFYFWINDLSAKDPYYITPLIMGATMFIQQKMTPTTMDPMQAKLFMLMPVIFTFMFLNFPSGLVIYWLVNNVLTIGQQYLINRRA